MKAQAGIKIQRSPEVVYRFMAENFVRNYPRWSPELRELQLRTEGPLRVGSIVRQVRVDQGRRSESIFRITKMVPGRRLSFEGRPPEFLVDYRFVPDDEGCTRLTFIFELRRLDLMMRPFEKLIRRAVQDGGKRTVHTLKQLIESDQESAAPRLPGYS